MNRLYQARVAANVALDDELSARIRGHLQVHMRHLYLGREFLLDVVPSELRAGEVKGGIIEKFEEFGRYRDDETWMDCESFRPVVRISASYEKNKAVFDIKLIAERRKDVRLMKPLAEAVEKFAKENKWKDFFGQVYMVQVRDEVVR